MLSTAPRIYDLNPFWAGPLDTWDAHFSRIAAMGFDTVHVPGLMAPGASGSLLAIADPFEIHPSLRGPATAPAAELIRDLVRQAAGHALAITTDLPTARVAIDAKLLRSQPAWFAWADDRPIPAGEPVWGAAPTSLPDRTDLRFDAPDQLSAQVAYAAEIATYFLKLGLAGFRCPKATAAPAAFWHQLLAELRQTHPRCMFLAQALGVAFEEVMALEGLGFDYVMDSSRWWDFRLPWYPEQREMLRRVAGPIAFPEEPMGQRLGEGFALADDGALSRLYLARYKIAATLGTALIMPMGYEYASGRRFDAAGGSPEEWAADVAAAKLDLGEEIAVLNAAKAASPALNCNGRLVVVSAPNAQLPIFLRLDKDAPARAETAAGLILNPHPNHAFATASGPLLTAAGGRVENFIEVGTAAELEADTPLEVHPLDARLYLAQQPEARPFAPLKPPTAGNRVAIEKVEPEIDGGRFPAKRIVGERVAVSADIVCDGHDLIAAQILYRTADETGWRTAAMAPINNDRWGGSFTVKRNTRYLFTIEGWKDPFASWRHEVERKHEAGVPIALELIEGRAIVERALKAASGAQAPTGQRALRDLLAELDKVATDDQAGQLALLLSPEVQGLMRRAGPRDQLSRYEHVLPITVDRTAAAFSAWYELFPRSMSDDPARHGTFDDVIAKLPYIREMGFDVLYMPPIHPIGQTNRKGRNNSLTPGPEDPGSPYAIGAAEGGHDAIHPELGTLEDFKRLIDAAADAGLEVAIDFAIQCSPDHPWIQAHKGWFDWRPDGSIRYAENPPKKYQDIVNVDFYAEGAQPGLWEALRDVVLYWCEVGIRIFRVDNPHTKPLPFWEWLIAEVRERYPDSIYLAEAFTRPKMMKRLAKIGFTQSYSYFTWRNTKGELTDYLTELTQEECKDYMRVNFFVNTPDINPVPLQTAGRAGFRTRALLAATLSPIWGLYSGFELCEATPLPGREEYQDSEKYEIKAWDWDRPGHIRTDIALFNRLRRENPALAAFRNLDFLPSSGDQVLVYAKTTPDLENIVVIAVNLDPHQPQGSAFELPLWRYGLPDDASVTVQDLIGGHRFEWRGKNQEVWLDPESNPYALWRVVLPGLPA